MTLLRFPPLEVGGDDKEKGIEFGTEVLILIHLRILHPPPFGAVCIRPFNRISAYDLYAVTSTPRRIKIFLLFSKPEPPFLPPEEGENYLLSCLGSI